MTALNLFWHGVSFIAPAFWLGLGMAGWDWLANRLTMHAQPALRHWRRSLLLDWAIGIAVLLVGLALTGHDGRMLTYGTLVLAISVRRWLTVAMMGER